MPPYQTPDADALLAMSSRIAEQVDKYIDMIRASPETNEDTSSLPGQKLQQQADALAQECRRLQASVSEPTQWMVQTAWSYCDSVALSLIIEMGIPKLIEPDSSGVTLSYLADSTNASPALIRRIMTLCVNRFIFTECNTKYHHNRYSLQLLDGNFGSLVHYLVDDGLLCGALLTRTLARDGFQIQADPKKAAFGVAFQTDLPLYEYYHSVDTHRGQRFARAMAGHYDGPLDKPIELIFPFGRLPNGCTLVDIGGGNGQNAIRLVSTHRYLLAVVQDHPSVISVAETAISKRLSPEEVGRITWEAHDYYGRQPRRGADVYLLSHVLMDNSDENCILMLQSIAEAMDATRSTLLIHDFVDLPRDGQDGPLLLDMLDLHMIASLNTHSRSEAEFDALLAGVEGGRLVRHKTWPGRDGSAVLEIRVRGGEEE